MGSHTRGGTRIGASIDQAILVPPRHPVTLPPSHPVTPSPCHPLTLSPRHEATSRHASRVILASFLAGLLLLGGCAGYHVGTASLYPTNIQTVYVPIFESDSFRRYLGERLTEAVIKEINLKTSLTVTGDSSADSILSGRITHENKRVMVLNKYHDPRENEVSLQVQVRWLDRQSNLIREASPVPLPDELANIRETALLVPEVGHSVSTAQQQAIQRLAVQIVSMMEAPW